MTGRNATRQTVLAVDDQPANLRLLDAVLSPRGFEVLAAEGHFVYAPEDPVDATPGEEIEEGTQRTDEESGLLFVRQELPTAGTLTLAGGLARDAERQPDEVGEDDYDGSASILLRQPLLRGGGLTVGNREITEAGYTRDIFDAPTWRS